MSLKILLTADNHIGLRFEGYPDEVKEVLEEERFVALERLIQQANTRHADFVVVAGDLFDRLGVPAGDVKRALGILGQFHGTATLLLPGNHDFCEGPDSKLWARIVKECHGSVIVPITKAKTLDFAVGDRSVQFFACPCPSKTSPDPMTGWVTDAPKDPEALHIGVAHGNVTGLGLDLADRYFSMREPDLKAAGLATWLLGHVHIASPTDGTVGTPPFFMPGTHTPDCITSPHRGHAWWIEFEGTSVGRYEQLTSGALQFARLTRTLQHATELESLEQECDALDARHTVLDLELSGRLSEQDLQRLQALLQDLSHRFLHLTHETDITTVLDAEAIAKQFPDGTLSGKLLNALLEDDLHPGDANLALQLLEGLRNQ
jgi:exonuclease SbcD